MRVDTFRFAHLSLSPSPAITAALGKLESHLGLSRPELLTATVFFAIEALLKVWMVFYYRFNSDEPQHLHVVWGWTHGLVQYRDLFDNHMPLFQILCAPILALLGDHAGDLYVMRFLMLPLYFVSAWCIFRIGKLVFSARVGTWSVIAAGAVAKYFFCSTEFRTDNLWTVFWLLAVWTLLKGELRRGQAMVAGLLLGLAFAVSMKSILMLLALFVGGLFTLLLCGENRLIVRRLRNVNLLVFLACAVIPPLLIIAFFAARGVWPELRYCVFEHNIGDDRTSASLYAHLLALPVGLAALVSVTRYVSVQANSLIEAARKTFLCSVCGAYIVLLFSLWHHVTRQDYLPFYPLAAILAVAGLLALERWWQIKGRLARFFHCFPSPALAIALLLLQIFSIEVPSQNEAAMETELVRNILALTSPTDVVFDGKGETIFRRRSVYEVFEGLTRSRVRRNLMPDDVPQRCVSTRTCVAVTAGGLTASDMNFIESNYLPVANQVRVVGCYIPDEAAAESGTSFNVVIPARYALVAGEGEVRGLLDGKAYEGARFLAPGKHEFRLTSSAHSLVLIWAQAPERHFTPLLPTPHA